ncbi:D-alanyl-D-alanine carboxypeptidase family protein [Streptomyces sp. GC420]|uniref:D-alanyl-D-alanine carboxypeptidase family protein n=1 Tax=Streptomyces sp. GC420 TaxID=2697568 RepID=UPI0014152CF8|nr:serine hydrolase [Streptomyces sp. GC420]NBM17795.1 D-alanyl-D-alanine carboxypeptidase [Streptomyces sp. GC420]
MRKATAFTVSVTAGAVLAVPALAAPAQAATAPTISAKGAYLYDLSTSTKLYGKDSNTKRQMASTTKIMTAAVVLNTSGLDLDRKVTVRQAYRDYVAAQGASTADLRTGDKLTVRQLLYGLMLPSGCDAAYALADTFGSGDTRSARTKSFIGKMNKKASDLGMTNTKFDSFDGISSTGNNYTTPKDLTKLARYAMKSSTFRSVVKTTKTVRYATTSTGGTRTYTWYNTNKLLGSYNGAVGIKTGTGSAAGPCLVFAATRGEKTVVGVILNDTNRYTDAAKLLDYAFGSSTATTMKLRSLPSGAQQD